jgi:hypothetical protein
MKMKINGTIRIENSLPYDVSNIIFDVPGWISYSGEDDKRVCIPVYRIKSIEIWEA